MDTPRPATQVVLGLPIVSNDLAKARHVTPVGQVDLFQTVRNAIKDQTQFHQAVCKEYMAIFFALRKMRVPFLVLDAHRQFISPQFREMMAREGCAFLPMPDIDRELLGYPRDLLVSLPNGVTLLDRNAAPLLPTLGQNAGRFIVSPLGQGGRVHLRRNIALVPEIISPDHKITPVQEYLAPFAEAEVHVGILPNTILLERVETITGYTPDDHLDRTSALVEGPTGDLHLFLAPRTRSGFRDLYSPGRYGPKETKTIYERVCDPLGIAVHVLLDITVPGATNLHQFAGDGRVLMTNGDDELAQMVAEVVGAAKVFRTPAPIQYYPVSWQAGIRCLIGEFPVPFCTAFNTTASV